MLQRLLNFDDSDDIGSLLLPENVSKKMMSMGGVKAAITRSDPNMAAYGFSLPGER